MITDDAKKLLGRLNKHLTRVLDSAVGVAVKRRDPEVSLEHLLLTLLQKEDMDLALILEYFEVEADRLRAALHRHLDGYRREEAGRPTFSPSLLKTVESALLIGSVHHGLDKVRSGTLVAAMLRDDTLRTKDYNAVLSPVHRDTLRDSFSEIMKGSIESPSRPSEGAREKPDSSQAESRSALDQYTISFNERASDGDIDPIFRRGEEIRQLTDILSRRRKNNPILVGEAGVGKTAIVEGLARRITVSEVRDSLDNLEIRSLDVGALRAGASVQGEFEKRLKSVLREVREAERTTVLFVDEAHTLIGAGGKEGTGDAANLLKPALARGELRAIAATTWSEYRQHIENDAALERRFQMVQVDEPSVEDAAAMLRGIKSAYEEHHAVPITEGAVKTAAQLADRYVSGRQLPDKAVDLLDTAASRVKLSHSARPRRLDKKDRRLRELNTRIQDLRRDLKTGHSGDDAEVKDLVNEKREIEQRRNVLEEQWKQEKALVESISEARESFVRDRANGPKDGGDSDSVSPKKLEGLMDELQEAQNGRPMVHSAVDEHITAEVVSDWTGIPVGSMLEDEAELLLDLENRISSNVLGQDAAIEEVAARLRTSKIDLKDPQSPLGVFLFVGPTGVGKTETAIQLADHLFGGERFLTTINMSEYQEKHSGAQLKGAPPGYVGYGEGGVLTEAVRQKPYSVVLLDEIEKAHRDVMSIFYQVFDNGVMRDGEGREIDFRNTVIVMTSNLAAGRITEMVRGKKERPGADEIRRAIRPVLLDHFQPALLGRMTVVPYCPLDAETMQEIVELKLDEGGNRLEEVHDIKFEYEPSVVETIATRCTDTEAGARAVDFIVNRTIYPQTAEVLIPSLVEDEVPDHLSLYLDDEGDFAFRYE